MARNNIKKGGKTPYRFFHHCEKLLAAEQGNVPLEAGASLRIALVYANVYEVGMASMGVQTVYRLFNAIQGVRCERFFLFPPPDDREMRSIESHEALNKFDVVAFSLSFELDIPNVIRALQIGRVPLLAEQRTDYDPIVLLGGIVVSLNPSPLLPFMDGLLAGEGEGLFLPLTEALRSAPRGRAWRDKVKQALAQLEGLYVPGLSQHVERQVIHDLDAHPVYTPIVTPHSHFSSLFVVEVGRGCGRGCFFCAAQKLYMPVRYRSLDALLDTVDRHNPGAARVGLESAGISDYPDLVPLCEAIIQRGLGVSFSSVRADRITPQMIAILEKSNTRTFTIAPEAGTERLRQRIGKGLSDAEILLAVDRLRETNIDILKLYFIIGLPGETEEDIQGIIALSQEIGRRFFKPGIKRQVKISVNPFIPKPFTEYQWAPLAPANYLKSQHKRLEQALHRPPLYSLSEKMGRAAYWQTALALGDEAMGLEIARALEQGHGINAILNGLAKENRQTLTRERPENGDFPWEFIDYTVDKSLLWKRYKNSLRS